MRRKSHETETQFQIFLHCSEDYLVEAMEIVEMFCDLLLARFGLLTQMKELDSGIAEQVSSLIWVAPRLQSDVEELRGKSFVKFFPNIELIEFTTSEKQ